MAQKPELKKPYDIFKSAFEADTYYYLHKQDEENVQLRIDFTQGDDSMAHFAPMLNALTAKFGAPSDIIKDAGIIVYKGPTVKKIHKWLEGAYPAKETIVKEDQARIHEILDEMVARDAIQALIPGIKVVTPAKKEKLRAAKISQGKIPLNEFVRALGVDPAVPAKDEYSPDALCNTILNLRTALRALSEKPDMPVTAIFEKTYEDSLRAELTDAITTMRPALARTRMQNLLEDASIEGNVSLSKMADDKGFNLTLVKPVKIPNALWEKKAKALGEVLTMLLAGQDENPDIQISGNGSTMVVKNIDPNGALYRVMLEQAATQGTKRA